MPVKRNEINADDLIREYLSGKTAVEVASIFGTTRARVRRILESHSIPVRGRGDTNRILMARRTPEENSRNTAAAHAAARGRKVSIEERSKTAKTLERRHYNVGCWEHSLAEMLSARGIVTVPQKAIGPYNCDLAAYPVAVEVFGGNFHFFGHHYARLPKRVRYLLDAGWDVLMVLTYPRYPITDACADDLAAYVDAARRNPTKRREYWVILGTGDPIAGGSGNDNQLSIERTLAHCKDVCGQYKRRSR